MVIWQLSDGKRGHERQAEGLIAALKARLPVESEKILLEANAGSALDALRGRLPWAPGGASPTLVIGAGRRCQWPLVAARRALAARTVCLMRPALPRRWFDACVIPAHDRPRAAANVIVSQGPLHPVRPGPKVATLGLILLGGPSRHYAWNDAAVMAQVRRIIAGDPACNWQLADSRRTPPACAAGIRADADLAPRFHAFADTAADWLPQQLAAASRVWVTGDSMAMIYEALGAGATVGILTLPARRSDRITRHVDELIADGRVATVDRPAQASFPPLDEAGRVVDELIARWPGLSERAGT